MEVVIFALGFVCGVVWGMWYVIEKRPKWAYSEDSTGERQSKS